MELGLVLHIQRELSGRPIDQQSAIQQDVQAKQGNGFSLKAFHDSVLGLGGLRYPLQREALLGPDSGSLLE